MALNKESQILKIWLNVFDPYFYKFGYFTCFFYIICIQMINYPSLDLQATANFTLQKNQALGTLQKSLQQITGIHRTIKTDKLRDDSSSNSDQENILNECFQSFEFRKHDQQNISSNFKPQNGQRAYNKKEREEKNLNGQGFPPVLQKRITFSVDQKQVKGHSQCETYEVVPTIIEKYPDFSQYSKSEMNNQNARSNENQLNNSDIDIDIPLAGGLSSMEYFPKRQRAPLGQLALNHQVAITYIPLKYANAKMQKASFYLKLNQKSQASLDAFSSKSLSSSVPSGQKNQLKDCMVNSTANFVKLHEIDLFMKRKGIKIERSDQLLQANQKLLAGHLIAKQQLQKLKKQIQRLNSEYRNKVQHMDVELALQKESKRQILIQKELKQTMLKNVKTLNEQYLKENNELKEKVKDYIKNIHELKCELTYKRNCASEHDDNSRIIENPPKQTNKILPSHTTKSINPPLATIPSVNELIDPGRQTNRTKRNVTLANECNEATSITNMQQKNSKLAKLYNCNSQANLVNIKYANQRKLSINDAIVEVPLFINARQNSKSQKSIGIKRNNVPHQFIPSPKNLVQINKNIANDTSAIIKRCEEACDKSISGYSNISGKSFSQKIGYIPRPPAEPSQGVILDYMIQSPNEGKVNSRTKIQRFQFKK